MRYCICDKCKKLIEYKPNITYEGGITYTTIVCPECGYTKTTNTNHVHYGDDGKR